jgi:hypothetical protein
LGFISYVPQFVRAAPRFNRRLLCLLGGLAALLLKNCGKCREKSGKWARGKIPAFGFIEGMGEKPGKWLWEYFPPLGVCLRGRLNFDSLIRFNPALTAV